MERTTYEIMNPEDVGLTGNRIVLGKHSGRHAFVDALTKLGYAHDAAAVERAFVRFKAMADRKATITDNDLVALVTEETGTGGAAGAWTFVGLAVSHATDRPPAATVRLSRDGVEVEESATGDGMIDAACNAVAKAVGAVARLVSFQVAAVDEGSDAVGDVSVAVEVNGERVVARGVSVDVVEASARAFLNAVNKVVGGTAVAHRTDKP
jgi:2-isopropylmalate synthase